jgi:hypothetical protein
VGLCLRGKHKLSPWGYDWYKQVTTFGNGVSTIWENFGGTYKMEEFNLAKNAQIFAIAEDLIQWH